MEPEKGIRESAPVRATVNHKPIRQPRQMAEVPKGAAVFFVKNGSN
jgi:hypothetical protein